MTGDPNAAIDRAQPLVLGPQFGAHGATAADLSVAFTSAAAAADGNDAMTTRRRRVGVRGTRGIGLGSMVRNSRLARVRVAPTGLVTVDGEPVSSEAAERTSLTRLYLL